MTTITVSHAVPRDDLALGLVRAEGISSGPAPAPLATELSRLVALRGTDGLPEAEEALRRAGRDILRNGRYKPTGRGKPASEYLLRAARQGEFPRINGPVDANNLVSLAHCVAISVWDLDLACTDHFELRLGQPNERYVFNESGQELDLHDLVCGCGLCDDGSRAMVTPIKDSLATKLTPNTTRVAGAIYYPVTCGPERLEQATAELLRWLEACGSQVRGAMALCLPDQTVTL